MIMDEEKITKTSEKKATEKARGERVLEKERERVRAK